MDLNLTEEQRNAQMMARRFTENEIIPIADEYDHEDKYPAEVADKMAELGLFGIILPQEYGGMEMDYVSYALVIEEISRGWMSIAGILNSHLMVGYMIANFGTEEQKQKYIPALASGERRGSLGLTEAEAGSDTASMKSTAKRDGDDYVINGNKMFITNSERGNTFAVLAKTDTEIRPQHRGISALIVDKGTPGFTVGRKIEKLGYKGLRTCELVFEDCRVPKDALVGKEGEGLKYVLNGLEVGRINVAARAVGVARAAFEDSIKYAQQRVQFGKPICEFQAIQSKLAEMATKIEAARLLTLMAADKKNRGERCDLEAGMAKLFASELSVEASLEGIQIHGGYGYTKEFSVERYLRDACLFPVGEGTSEIQKMVIARRLLEKYKI